jgi:sugar lactone lactonase YvrE
MRFTRYPYAAAAAVCAIALSACGGSSISTTPVASSNGTTLQSAQQVRPLTGQAAAVYASDFYGKSVFRFVRNANGTLQTPAGSSLVLGYNPGAIAIGSSGALFVADEENESLEVYPKDASGYASATRTLLLPFVPSAVAVDGAGYEYAGGFSNGYVAVYKPGAKGTANTIERIALPDGHPDINGLAIDSKGNLYVSDTNEISEFATPRTNPTLVRAIVGTGQQNTPSGMTIGQSGELYAANTGDSNILAYSPTANGDSAPDRTISSSSPPLIAPNGVAIHSNYLYTTSGNSLDGPPSIFVLNAQQATQAPIQVITGSYLSSPYGVAVGP